MNDNCIQPIFLRQNHFDCFICEGEFKTDEATQLFGTSVCEGCFKAFKQSVLKVKGENMLQQMMKRTHEAVTKTGKL